MMLTGYSNEHRKLIDDRANAIMSTFQHLGPCSCGDASRGHAPDCAYVIAADGAWDYAQEQAADELEDAGRIVWVSPPLTPAV